LYIHALSAYIVYIRVFWKRKAAEKIGNEEKKVGELINYAWNTADLKYLAII
jgi:hypothetical protein